MSVQHPGAQSAYCLNCHYTLPSAPRPGFCGHCGQETDLHPPSVHEFVHEYVGHYVALEGPLWRSLWALLFLPGQLTREYFAGRRRHYVLPLRIYLSASFLFFVGSHLLPDRDPAVAVEAGIPHEGLSASEALAAARSAAAASVLGAGSPVQINVPACDGAGKSCTGFKKRMAALGSKLEKIDQQQWRSRLGALAPYGMLLMQPVFAALLLLMFAGTGRRYAEHFVFSLHSHAFWFLALLAGQVVALDNWLLCAVFLHGVLALRTVYVSSWLGSLWRGILLSLGYLVCLLIGLIGMAVIVLMASP